MIPRSWFGELLPKSQVLLHGDFKYRDDVLRFSLSDQGEKSAKMEHIASPSGERASCKRLEIVSVPKTFTLDITCMMAKILLRRNSRVSRILTFPSRYCIQTEPFSSNWVNLGLRHQVNLQQCKQIIHLSAKT